MVRSSGDGPTSPANTWHRRRTAVGSPDSYTQREIPVLSAKKSCRK